MIFGLDEFLNLSGVLHDIAVGIAPSWSCSGPDAVGLDGPHTLRGRGWWTSTAARRTTGSPQAEHVPVGYRLQRRVGGLHRSSGLPVHRMASRGREGALLMGMGGLIISVSLLIGVTSMVGMGRGAMVDSLRRNSPLSGNRIRMMMFAASKLLAYLTQPDIVAGMIGWFPSIGCSMCSTTGLTESISCHGPLAPCAWLESG